MRVYCEEVWNLAFMVPTACVTIVRGPITSLYVHVGIIERFALMSFVTDENLSLRT